MAYNELYHHGILGQKWGVRRYQNEDGSYTSEGKSRRNKYSDDYLKTKDLRKRILKNFLIQNLKCSTNVSD